MSATTSSIAVMHPISPDSPAPAAATASQAHAAGVFLVALLAYALVSQWHSHPVLSTFGVANALMIGVLVRIPSWRTWHSYGAIGMASMLASWMTDGAWIPAAWLAVADVAGIALGVTLLARLPVPILQMRRENSPLLVLLACLLASTLTTALRLLLQWPSEEALQAKSIAMALSTEFMNHVLILPMVLTWTAHFRWHRLRWKDAIPLVALLISELLAVAIGGPGAIAFTLPAFIWCALRYPLYATAALFAAFTLWKCQAFAIGHSSMSLAYFSDMVSLRVGLSLLWLGPLTVACSHAARTEVLRRLNYASQHDYLTRTLVRATFVQRSETALAAMRRAHAPMAVLMLDIDHFKQVNDHYGHAMGDVVLQGFAAIVSQQLRENDLIGRYGGEEFCLCLPGISATDSVQVAERLRAAVLSLSFTTPQGSPLHVTVSLGLAHYAPAALPQSIDAAMAQADTLLYRAKNRGRNRVEHSLFTSPTVTETTTSASNAQHSSPQAVKG